MKDLNNYSREELKRIISFCKLKSFIINSILKVGLAADYAWPFIFAGLISLYGYESVSLPYVVEKVDNPSKNLRIDLSEFESKTFLYSTAWHNIKGSSKMYRTEILYKLKDSIDLSQATSILNMTEEEMNKAFEIERIQTFEKTNKEDDFMYFSDLIILPHVFDEEGEIAVRSKMHKDDKSLMVFLICSFLGGLLLKKGEELLTNCYVKNKISGQLEKLNDIYREELAELVSACNRARKTKQVESKSISFQKMRKN